MNKYTRVIEIYGERYAIGFEFSEEYGYQLEEIFGVDFTTVNCVEDYEEEIIEALHKLRKEEINDQEWHRGQPL